MPQSMTDGQDIENLCVNTIRALALDAVAKANSGHSGTAMALAPLAHVLFTRIMKFDPKNPTWMNRDRFVLSAGHASMLLYSMLHLSGYELSLEDIKNFRQWGSLTPGHPEVHHTPGVEVTTGPLGQGFAHGVGMAIAEEHLRAKLGSDVIDHNIFIICSDGDLMEGISYEAASFAGHQKLSKIIAIYDDNKITIDGKTDLTFSEDVAKRFIAQGWNVIEAGEISEDLDKLEQVIRQAQSQDDAPTLVILRSHIGYPSQKFIDTSAAHGAITDKDEIATTKATMGLSDKEFDVNQSVYEFYRDKCSIYSQESDTYTSKYSGVLSDLISGTNEALEDLTKGDLGEYFESSPDESTAPSVGDSIATRVSCADVLSTINKNFEYLIGGSADLTGNTGTKLAQGSTFSPDNRNGNQIHFGIREHAMAAFANGMALSYNIRPFVGTFFVFSDYMRPSIRLAALTNARVLFVFSHDSIGVGEDGPTHQPIEQLNALRAMPNLDVIRPADAYETAAGIEYYMNQAHGPVALVTTRQNVPVLQNTQQLAQNGVAKGAYILCDVSNPDVVLAASGSEVYLCVQAQQMLSEKNINARVVSVPSLEKLLRFSESAKSELFPLGIPVVSIEAGSTNNWREIANSVIGIDTFGASAPANDVFSNLGITSQAIVDVTTKLVSK